MPSVCCASKCTNNKNKCSQLSFFRFPKDKDRAVIWFKAAGRCDLLEKEEKAYETRRLCGIHFRDDMFSDPYKRSLKSNAIPTLFGSSESSSIRSEHSYSLFVDKEHEQRIAAQNLDCVAPLVSFGTQTEKCVAEKTSREGKLDKDLKNLRRKYARLVARFERRKLAHITLEQYKECTFKFCQTPTLARFINSQIELSQKNSTRPKYTQELKATCLHMYLLGPKLYKEMLQKLFLLPTPRMLRKYMKSDDILEGVKRQQSEMNKRIDSQQIAVDDDVQTDLMGTSQQTFTIENSQQSNVIMESPLLIDLTGIPQETNAIGKSQQNVTMESLRQKITMERPQQKDQMEDSELVNLEEAPQESNTKESLQQRVAMGYPQQTFIIVNHPQQTDAKDSFQATVSNKRPHQQVHLQEADMLRTFLCFNPKQIQKSA